MIVSTSGLETLEHRMYHYYFSSTLAGKPLLVNSNFSRKKTIVTAILSSQRKG